MPHQLLCPVWLGYFLLNPLRKLFQNPVKILGPHVKSGDTLLEVGPGMGYFTLSMAQLVGAAGRVVCVDLQAQMLFNLEKRARRAGLLDRIETRTCRQESLGISDLEGLVDFTLAFAVVHEVPDMEILFREIHLASKNGARLLVSEPRGHVRRKNFDEMLMLAKKTGFSLLEEPDIALSISALLRVDKS
ncbi:MAG: methyltransferase type 11 [Bdellovibrionales bacterium RIFOXYD1_FULL_53_11]|nr:MAG: methyltransferase type 11 [Bdellovibrionales bacterium RIFOXYD1_FULL_53_11]